MIIGYTNLRELLKGLFHNGKERRKQSGIESNSLPDKHYKERDDNLKMKLRRKMENEEWTWSLGRVPSAAPRTHQ